MGVTTVTAVLVAGTALAAGSPAQAAPSTAATGASSTVATATGAAGAVRSGREAADLATGYWTAARMKAAVSADVLAPASTTAAAAAVPTAKPTTVPSAGPLKALRPTAARSADARALAVNASATVGKVFFTNPSNGGGYVCSASTVNSGSKLLVMTAGHCVHGGRGGQWMQNWIFVPLYNYGSEPYGRWSAKYLTSFNGWINDSSLDRDVGWVTVWPNGAGQRVVNVVGGNGLSVNYSYEQAITILGYPAEPPYDGGAQWACQGTTYRPGTWPFQENKIALNCGLTGGSSGGPWLRVYDGSLGALNGVMSTLNSSGTNKASYFDTAVLDIYNSVANRV
jgi:V8-like Glu-specific endopeptidase